MIELRTKTFTLPAKINSEVCKSFKRSIIFYLAHKKDMRAFFTTFVILNFENREITYVTSYLPENVARIDSHPQSETFRIPAGVSNAHCTLQEKKEAPFITFTEFIPFFLRIDYKKNLLYVYSNEDFEKEPDESIADFSPTNYPDPENHRHFYFYSEHLNRKTLGRKLVLHRASIDLSEIKTVNSKTITRFVGSPHTIRKINRRYILNSHFLHCQLKNQKNGKIFENPSEYGFFVYNSLYKQYCQEKEIPFSSSFFQGKSNFLEIEAKVNSEHNFAAFCCLKGKNFLEICKRNIDYSFIPLSGSITLLNLENKKEKIFNTTAPAPAHFEIDEKTGDIFVSSHSFINFGRVLFWGPAAIDRFHLENGELKKMATFSHSTGYRFTSHKVFTYKDKTYVCTFGQPNRLFVIDAETMDLVFYEDIGIDFISGQEDLSYYFNSAKLDPFVIKTIEVSEDGQFIFFLSYDYIYFYSFPERKIVQKMKYLEGASPDGEIILSDFYKKTTHASYLN